MRSQDAQKLYNKLLVSDVSYGREESGELRNEIIKLRDEQLGPETFNPTAAVLLSHVIAWMHVAMQIIFDGSEK